MHPWSLKNIQYFLSNGIKRPWGRLNRCWNIFMRTYIMDSFCHILIMSWRYRSAPSNKQQIRFHTHRYSVSFWNIAFLYANNKINIINYFKLCKSVSVCTYFKKLMQVLIYNSLSVSHSVYSDSIQIYLYVFFRIFIQLWHIFQLLFCHHQVYYTLQFCWKLVKKTFIKVAWQFRLSEIIFHNTACFKLGPKGTSLSYPLHPHPPPPPQKKKKPHICSK